MGLNSGQVIAGEIGSGALGYTAIGEQVGMAQRMESVAPPGGVMLSESTADWSRARRCWVSPSWCDQGRRRSGARPAAAGDGGTASRCRPTESTLSAAVGNGRHRRPCWIDAIGGRGAVVGVVGSPGIGKSRLVREITAMAAGRGVEVFSAFCESHASDIPFHVVARLLRAAIGVSDLEAAAARAQVRGRVPDADPEDLVLLDDLLGIADPEVALPDIDPDARRRRLTALVNAASLARQTPAVYVIEDVHWIDEVSESMLADFLAVIPQTPALVLITYRPEYRGALTRVPGAQTIALAPLSDAETSALVAELLGPDPSVGALGQHRSPRGPPVTRFSPRRWCAIWPSAVCCTASAAPTCSTADVAEVSMPATLQATIAARIDRLDPVAKRTLSAAAVIGSRFGPDLLETLGDRTRRRGSGDGRTRRSGEVYPTTGVCVSPSADPLGGLRVTAQIRSRRAAPAPRRRDRITRSRHRLMRMLR